MIIVCLYRYLVIIQNVYKALDMIDSQVKIKNLRSSVMVSPSVKQVQPVKNLLAAGKGNLFFSGSNNNRAKKESKSFFGSIRIFILRTFNFIFVQPICWLREKVGFINKSKRELESNSMKTNMERTSRLDPKDEIEFHAKLKNGAPWEEITAILEKIPALINTRNVKGESILAIAVKHRVEPQLVRVLLGVEPSLIDDKNPIDGSSILHQSLKAGEKQSTEILDILLDAKPTLLSERDDFFAMNVLHCAAVSSASSDVIKYLIEKRPELVTETYLGGNSLMHAAVSSNNPKVIESILEIKPELIKLARCQNELQESPLHFAAELCTNTKVIDLLLMRNPALIDGITAFGNTVLHDAAKKNSNSQVLRRLIHAKPTLTEAKNWLGQTPLDIAKKQGNQIAIECLSANH